jgi:hypothetical protein
LPGVFASTDRIHFSRDVWDIPLDYPIPVGYPVSVSTQQG